MLEKWDCWQETRESKKRGIASQCINYRQFYIDIKRIGCSEWGTDGRKTVSLYLLNPDKDPKEAEKVELPKPFNDLQAYPDVTFEVKSHARVGRI